MDDSKSICNIPSEYFDVTKFLKGKNKHPTAFITTLRRIVSDIEQETDVKMILITQGYSGKTFINVFIISELGRWLKGKDNVHMRCANFRDTYFDYIIDIKDIEIKNKIEDEPINTVTYPLVSK